MGKVGPGGCAGFLLGGTGACPLVDGAGSCASGGQGHVRVVFWGVCGLSMTLGCLSADGWGCIPVLLVVWSEVFQH